MSPTSVPPFTTLQLLLRIFSLLLSLSCLGVTIRLSVHFSVTHIPVYIALMISLFISEASIMRLLSKPDDDRGPFAQFHILVVLETCNLLLWVAAYVMLVVGTGKLAGAEEEEEVGKGTGVVYENVQAGMVVGTISLHAVMISIYTFDALLQRRQRKQHDAQQIRLRSKRRSSGVGRTDTSRSVFSPSEATHSRPLPAIPAPPLLRGPREAGVGVGRTNTSPSILSTHGKAHLHPLSGIATQLTFSSFASRESKGGISME